MSTNPPSPLSRRSIRAWQVATVTLLFLGYAGYYACRTQLSVSTPLLIAESPGGDINEETLGIVVSFGAVAYMIGKLLGGPICDFAGGRRIFLLGMGGSIAATLAFAMGSGIPTFTLIWSMNRLFQSLGWGAVVKVSSGWFSFRTYGRVMGIVSLSFVFGDAVLRWFFGRLLGLGLGWRGLFLVAAALLGLVAIANLLFLRNGPRDVGLAEPEVHPQNVYGDTGAGSRPESLRGLILPILRTPSFWLVALLSMGLTLLRESLNFWSPQYLVQVGGLSPAEAAEWSLVFPLFGGFSVLAVGYASDRLAGGRRGGIMAVLLGPLALILLVMGLAAHLPGAWLPIVLLAGAGFLLVGPYSFLAGAISIDLGARRGSSTAAGLVDAAGYVGAILSGWGVGYLARHQGWGSVFAVLGGVALLMCVVAIVYLLRHERRTAGSGFVRRSVSIS
jgi:OPA family glycerol-3-phosphate transporter-like MFS transporter